MDIKPGKMNKRIIIQQKVADNPVQNGFGEPYYTATWEAFATVWAAVKPIIGREFWAQQQEQAEITTKVRIRYKSGITSIMRVLYGTRILDIQFVQDVDEKHKEMILLCKEGVNDG